MLEYPYDDQDERLMERCYWRRVGFVIFLAFLIALILGPLYGCATPNVPPCEKWGYTPAMINDERAIILDQEGMGKLKNMLNGLAAGTCRLPVAGTDA